MRARILDEANRKWLTLAAVSFGLFMIMLDNTVVTVALPSIQRDLGADRSGTERTPRAFDGFSTALVVAAVIAFAGAVVAAALVRPHPERKGAPVPEVA